MSLFNFNPSGFLGSGAFALDPSKFDFSNITVPKPVDDPIAIVSDKTPDTEVEILEGAGTVAITEKAPDPIEDAIKTVVKPTPTSQPEEVVIPEMFTPTAPVDLGMNFGLGDIQTSTDNLMSQDNLALGGAGSGFDVSQTAIDKMINQGIVNRNLLDPLLEGYEKFNVSTGDRGLIEGDVANNLMDFVTTDDFNNLVNQYSQLRTGEQTGGQTVKQMASREVLDALGIPNLFETRDDQDRASVYQFNTSTGEFDLIRQYGGTDSVGEFVDAAAPALLITAATAGLGGALAGSLGVSGSAIGTGVTNAVVNAGLQQAITGDVDLIQAATAGFNAGLNSYADATKAATEAASVVGATAEMADTARNMQSTLEVLETVKDTINLAEAIDDKNVLGAIDISLGMADLPNTKTFVADKLQEAFPDSDIVTRHADSLASATIKTGVKLAEGESVGDAVKSGLLEYVKQGGGLGIDVPDINFEIDFGIGESDMLERIDQWIRALPTTKEDWERWEDNVKNSADAVVRALPTTKEDWQNLEQIIKDGAEVVKTTVVDPVVSVVRETGRAIEEGYDTVEDFVKEDVVPVVRETGRDIREAVDPVANVVRDTGRAIEEVYGEAEDFVKEDVAPVVREVGRDIRDIVPEVDVPSFSTPDISLPSLFGDSTQQQEQEEYGNIIGYDDMGMPIYDNTIEILANQLLTN